MKNYGNIFKNIFKLTNSVTLKKWQKKKKSEKCIVNNNTDVSMYEV